eukprot:6203324-Pleurochrysis_carterae.AAC.2
MAIMQCKHSHFNRRDTLNAGAACTRCGQVFMLTVTHGWPWATAIRLRGSVSCAVRCCEYCPSYITHITIHITVGQACFALPFRVRITTVEMCALYGIRDTHLSRLPGAWRLEPSGLGTHIF